MPDPPPVGVGALPPGVQGQLPPPGVVGSAHDHLKLHAAVLGEHEGSLQRQLLEYTGQRLFTGPQGKLHEGRTGQQCPAQHHVVREPGVGGEREAGR